MRDDGMPKTFGLADFRLKVLDKDDNVVAESGAVDGQYVMDSVGHLHFPAPVDGNVGDYKLRVVLNRHAIGTDRDHPYSVAWWVDDTPAS